MKKIKLYEEFIVEAKAYKLKASDFGSNTFSAAYNVKGEPTWRVHSTYAIDQVSGENNADERDVVFFEAMPINNDIYIKIGGINNLKKIGATVGNNFGTTIEEWKKDPKGIAKEASDFLTDATHLKWINKKARSQGQTIKWALKDDYSSVIEDLVNKSLGLSESIVNEGKTSAVYTDPKTGKGYDLQYVSSKKRWELDIMKKGASIYSNAITTIKRDTLAEIQEWLDGYKIDSSWTKGLSESLVTEASKDRMIKQIERALKDGTSIFKLPMATQKYYNKNKSDFENIDEATITERKMPTKYIGNDEIVFLKTKETSAGAHYNLYYKGHDIDLGGQSFKSEKDLKKFADDYILSNQWYNKLKHEDSKPLPEFNRPDQKIGNYNTSLDGNAASQ